MEPTPRHIKNKNLSARLFGTSNELTRSDKTAENYSARAEWFKRHAARQLGRSTVGPLEVAAFAIEKRVEWARSTWRQTKASLIFHFTSLNTQASLEAVQMLIGVSQADCLKRGRQTSGMRARKFSQEALDSLLQTIRGERSKYSSTLERWLVLGICTGLRPDEWGSSEVVLLDPISVGDSSNGFEVEELGDSLKIHYLRVANSKTTNGRAHGAYRHLNLSNLKPSVIESISQFCKLMNEARLDGNYDRYYRGCQQLLLRSNKKSNNSTRKGKFIQLYSPRHKFSSDAKLVYSPAQVAALMGHSTVMTAVAHYGKSHSGTRRNIAIPVTSEVARVNLSKRAPFIPPTPHRAPKK